MHLVAFDGTRGVWPRAPAVNERVDHRGTKPSSISMTQWTMPEPVGDSIADVFSAQQSTGALRRHYCHTAGGTDDFAMTQAASAATTESTPPASGNAATDKRHASTTARVSEHGGANPRRRRCVKPIARLRLCVVNHR
jgi:hypothetical protein